MGRIVSALTTTQAFEHGDWNMGMSSYGLPPGESFDLRLEFELGAARVAGEIRDIECAEDKIPG